MSIHLCPKCQLRYLYRAEVELHLREDHREAVPDDQTEVTTPGPAPQTNATRRERSLNAGR
jgi:hypothetical protein